jgi:hypothetical protein
MNEIAKDKLRANAVRASDLRDVAGACARWSRQLHLQSPVIFHHRRPPHRSQLP